MERSRYIAGLIGPLLGLLGLSLLLNRELAPALAEQLSRDLGLIVVSGGLLLVAGLAIVRSHNVWTGWPVLVTLLGWLAVIGGVLRILIPGRLAALAPSLVQNGGIVTGVAVLVLVLGICLTAMSYRS